jgi:hypothetical protein
MIKVALKLIGHYFSGIACSYKPILFTYLNLYMITYLNLYDFYMFIFSQCFKINFINPKNLNC